MQRTGVAASVANTEKQCRGMCGKHREAVWWQVWQTQRGEACPSSQRRDESGPVLSLTADLCTPATACTSRTASTVAPVAAVEEAARQMGRRRRTRSVPCCRRHHTRRPQPRGAAAATPAAAAALATARLNGFDGSDAQTALAPQRRRPKLSHSCRPIPAASAAAVVAAIAAAAAAMAAAVTPGAGLADVRRFGSLAGNAAEVRGFGSLAGNPVAGRSSGQRSGHFPCKKLPAGRFSGEHVKI
eukprot:366360-Chlamydomonas_euryale.AAC.3